MEGEELYNFASVVTRICSCGKIVTSKVKVNGKSYLRYNCNSCLSKRATELRWENKLRYYPMLYKRDEDGKVVKRGLSDEF